MVATSFICWVVTVVAPDLAFSVANSWMHMINLDAVRTSSSANFGSALVGFVSLGVVAWIVSYTLVEVYNRLAKK